MPYVITNPIWIVLIITDFKPVAYTCPRFSNKGPHLIPKISLENYIKIRQGSTLILELERKNESKFFVNFKNYRIFIICNHKTIKSLIIWQVLLEYSKPTFLGCLYLEKYYIAGVCHIPWLCNCLQERYRQQQQS
jgi:hypothetical protein